MAHTVTARQLEARFRADAEHDYQDGVRYGRLGERTQRTRCVRAC